MAWVPYRYSATFRLILGIRLPFIGFPDFECTASVPTIYQSTLNVKLNYLRLSRVERPLAEVAGSEHLDEEGLAPVVRPDDGVLTDQVVRS